MAAGGELFSRYWLFAWRVAYAITADRGAADDVAQDAFERAFRGLAGFNGRSSFATWLSRIVVNRALDLRRRERPVEPLEAVEAGFLDSSDAAVCDRDVIEAVLKLDVDRRTVVALRYWGALTPAEIAETLDLPVGTVHSRLARALTELRTRLEEVLDADEC